MQNDRNFIEEITYQYRSGGMHVKLIFVNVVVYLCINLLFLIAKLTQSFDLISYLIEKIFALNADFSEFIFQPWGLITSIFSHFTFIHLALNMLVLYFAGKLFEHFFGGRRLLAIYLLGGIVGGLFEMLAHLAFPIFADEGTIVVGASGSIMAIFIGLAFYKPNLKASFIGLFEFPIIILALLYFAYDLFSLGMDDGTAHFAHIGGALVGVIGAQRASSSQNFIYRFEKMIYWLFGFFSNFKFKTSPRRKQVDPRKKTDEEFNLEFKTRQEKIDSILDKISKSGYESLSKAEKEFLFKQSNKS